MFKSSIPLAILSEIFI